jgi:uncharacterized membrane protein YkoI
MLWPLTGAGSAQVAAPNVLVADDATSVTRIAGQCPRGTGSLCRVSQYEPLNAVVLCGKEPMCHHVRQTITRAVVDGVHLNRRQHYGIAKADYRESWLMLKTRLTPFVILSTLVFGSPDATAKSTEIPHALDGQNSELEETIDRELGMFRNAQVSLQQALLIAERLHTGSRVVDISFDGASNPVYRVKNIQKEHIWENSIDARTGSSIAGDKHALSVKGLEAQDRRNLLALRAVRQNLSDAVVVAERSTRGKAISGGLINEDGTLYFVIVVDTAVGLKQVLLEPPRIRDR